MQISTRSYCYLLLWFGIIVMGVVLTPYFANDYRYFLVQGSDEFVASFSDLFISQYRHYFEWGGRTVAHVIAQLLLWWGKPLSGIIQGLCYVLLILFIYYNAYGLKPTLRLRFGPVFIISLLLLLQLRYYGEVVFNIVSASNYLYTTTLVLMFLLPYRISMEREVKANPIYFWPLMLVLGLVAGWTNENTAAAVATGLGLYLLYCLKERQLKLWQCLGYGAFLVGFALLVLAPGNRARLDSMEEGGFDYMQHTLGAVGIFVESLLMCALLVIAVIYLYLRVRKFMLQYTLPGTYHGAMWFIYTGLFSLVLMIFSPNFPARSATPFTVFTIVGIMGLGAIVLERYRSILPRKLERGLLGLGGVLMLGIVANIIYCAASLNNDHRVREAEILTQLEAGKRNLVVSPLHVQSYKYLLVADVRAAPDYWTNKIVADFLNVESIVRTCDYEPRLLPLDLKFFGTISPESECRLYPATTPAQAQK